MRIEFVVIVVCVSLVLFFIHNYFLFRTGCYVFYTTFSTGFTQEIIERI